MPDRSAGCTPRLRRAPNIPITARIAPGLVAQIEDAARSLGIRRHHVLQASPQLGFPLAITELTAQAAAARQDACR